MGQPSRSSSSLLYILLGLLAAAAGLVIGFIDETVGGDPIVPGKVVEVKEEPVAKGRDFVQQDDPLMSTKGPQMVYEYEDAEGKVHQAKHSISGKTYEEGQTLRIQYHRNNPKVSEIIDDKPLWHWIAMGGLLALAVILVLVGVLGLVLRRPALSTASPPAEPVPSPGPAALLPAAGPENNATGITAVPSQPVETPPAAITSEPKNEG